MLIPLILCQEHDISRNTLLEKVFAIAATKKARPRLLHVYAALINPDAQGDLKELLLECIDSLAGTTYSTQYLEEQPTAPLLVGKYSYGPRDPFYTQS